MSCPACGCNVCICTPPRTVKVIVTDLTKARLLVAQLENELSVAQEKCRHMEMLINVCTECFLYIQPITDVVT